MPDLMRFSISDPTNQLREGSEYRPEPCWHKLQNSRSRALDCVGNSGCEEEEMHKAPETWLALFVAFVENVV